MASKPQAGFTLLEIMVSVTIIGIALVTLIGSQSQSVSIATISRFDTTASLLAQQKMTELFLGGFDNLSPGNGDFGEDFPEYQWEVEVSDLTEDETGITGSEGILRAVDLTISLGLEGGQSYIFRQVMMAPPKPN